MATKDVAKRDEDNVARAVNAVAGIIPRDKSVIEQYLRAERPDADDNAVATHQEIIDQIFAADSLDDVLLVIEPEKLGDFVGRHLKIWGYKVTDSDFDSGASIYHTLRAEDVDNGTRHVINTGEQKVMAQLMRIRQLNALPFECTVVESNRPNRYGRKLLQLAPVVKPNG